MYDEELGEPRNYGQPTSIGLPEAWIMTAGSMFMTEPRPANLCEPHPIDLRDVWSQVKHGWEVLFTEHARGQGVNLSCPEKGQQATALLTQRKLDPLVVRAFDRVRAHYTDPSVHAPRSAIENMVDRLAVAL